ncbi:MAG: adenylate kinase [Anaerolinea sp.]|nr:adenylate kinase [Anaerolinea sp.]
MPAAPPLPVGPRIAIYGPSGSGKSTLARTLAEKLGLPCIELDSIFHAHPNWLDLTTHGFRDRVREILEANPAGWVIDGNYDHVRDLILTQADTVIWLRLPFWTVYSRLAWRTISRSFQNAELWNGNRETLRQTFLSKDSMLLWGITAWKRGIRKTAVALAETPHHARVLTLRNPRSVARLIERATLPRK